MSRQIGAAPFINLAVADRTIEGFPYLTNITIGKYIGSSLVFHTKEGIKHFEYCKNRVTSRGVNARCIYYREKKCKATISLEAKETNMINCEITPKGERNKYSMKNCSDLLNTEKWSVTTKIGAGSAHGEYCLNQVERRKRTYDNRQVDRKKERAKYCRLGPESACAREFRAAHVSRSIYTKELEMKSIKAEWNTEILHGPKFIPKITSVKNEKLASYYAQTRKTYQIIRAADIQDELKYIPNTQDKFPYRKFDEKFIHDHPSS